MPAAAAPEQAPVAHLLGWDCVEFWVGNARTFAGFLMASFGFRCTAYAGPETGVRDKASYVLEQGDIRFVVSGALTADSPIGPREPLRTGPGSPFWDSLASPAAAAATRGSTR